MLCCNIQVGNFSVEEALHFIQVNIPELAKEPALADEILTFTKCLPQAMCMINAFMHSPENRFRPLENLVEEYRKTGKQLGPLHGAF